MDENLTWDQLSPYAEYVKTDRQENTRIKNGILKTYDLFLNQKYNVDINQAAINNVKNLFQ